MQAIESIVMSLTVGQIIGWIAGIIAFLSVIIEFNKKINFDPISLVLGWLGNKINKGLNDKMDNMEEQIADIKKRQEKIEATSDEREAICRRVRILRFSDELRRDIKHSQESFEQSLSDIDNYDQYCKAHPEFKNNKTITARKRILDAYDKCLADNDFL